MGYLRTLTGTGPDITEVPAAPPGGLAHGAELYLANCAACHSSTGIGGTLSAAPKGAEAGVAVGRQLQAKRFHALR